MGFCNCRSNWRRENKPVGVRYFACFSQMIKLNHLLEKSQSRGSLKCEFGVSKMSDQAPFNFYPSNRSYDLNQKYGHFREHSIFRLEAPEEISSFCQNTYDQTY